jgi:hypothetical protein
MTDPPQRVPPAGWHPDPQYRGQQRYWDGQRWTDDRAPIPPPRLPDPPPPKMPEPAEPHAPGTTSHRRAYAAIAAVCAVVVAAIVVVALVHRAGKKITIAATYGLDTCQIVRLPGVLGTDTPVVSVHGTVTNLSNIERSFTFTVVAYDGRFPIASESGAETPSGGLQVQFVRPGETATIIAMIGFFDTSHPIPAAPTCRLVLDNVTDVG